MTARATEAVLQTWEQLGLRPEKYPGERVRSTEHLSVLKRTSPINLGTNKVTLSAWVNITGYTNSNFAALAQFASTNWYFDNNSFSSTPNEAGTWGVWAAGNGGLITEENSPGR